jgi:hypothetical protein
MSLETIEHMLSGFEEAVSIAEVSMTRDFIPYGQSDLSRLSPLFPSN